MRKVIITQPLFQLMLTGYWQIFDSIDIDDSKTVLSIPDTCHLTIAMQVGEDEYVQHIRRSFPEIGECVSTMLFKIMAHVTNAAMAICDSFKRCRGKPN